MEHEPDVDLVKVDHPEQFPLAAATAYDAAPKLDVTGVVNPDVSRNVPVISLASGRVLEIHAKLGDTVTKGQLLMRVQAADIAQAFSDYRQAVADETLAAAQLARAQLLFDKGAIAQKDLEVAQDADVKAKVTVETALEHLKRAGRRHRLIPHPSWNLCARVRRHYRPAGDRGRRHAGPGTRPTRSPSPTSRTSGSSATFTRTISHSCAWARFADIRLNAYPDLRLEGRIDNIGRGPRSQHSAPPRCASRWTIPG